MYHKNTSDKTKILKISYNAMSPPGKILPLRRRKTGAEDCRYADFH